MLTRVRNHRFRMSGTLAIAALSLLALAVPLSPAKAQCLGVDLGLVCAGLGLPSAFSHPYYNGYPYAAYPAYPYPYYNPNYSYAPNPSYAPYGPYASYAPSPSYAPNPPYP
jgi:hypothetical protein